LALMAIAASTVPAMAQSQAVKSLARGANHSMDAQACADARRTPEERTGFCRSAIKSGHFDMYLDLARLQRIQGQYDAALASLATLTARMPEIPDHPWFQSDDWVPILVERSIIYALMGRFDDAVKDADTIGRINVGEAENLNEQCFIRAVAGKELEQGLDDCNRSLERKPRVAVTLDSRGLIRFKLGRFQEALADYDAAVGRDSRFASSRFARGVVKLKLGDVAGGNTDIADAEGRDAAVAQELAGLGIAP